MCKKSSNENVCLVLVKIFVPFRAKMIERGCRLYTNESKKNDDDVKFNF